MTATTPTIHTAFAAAIEAAFEAQVNAIRIGSQMVMDLVWEHLPASITITVDSGTGALVALNEAGYTAWLADTEGLIPESLIGQIQRTVQRMLRISSDPIILADAGWLASTDGHYVIELG